jgi:hypothetical protein
MAVEAYFADRHTDHPLLTFVPRSP